MSSWPCNLCVSGWCNDPRCARDGCQAELCTPGLPEHPPSGNDCVHGYALGKGCRACEAAEEN